MNLDRLAQRALEKHVFQFGQQRGIGRCFNMPPRHIVTLNIDVGAAGFAVAGEDGAGFFLLMIALGASDDNFTHRKWWLGDIPGLRLDDLNDTFVGRIDGSGI